MKLFKYSSVSDAIDFLEKYDLVNESYYQHYLHKDEDYITITDHKRNKKYTFETKKLHNILSWMWNM